MKTFPQDQPTEHSPKTTNPWRKLFIRRIIQKNTAKSAFVNKHSNQIKDDFIVFV